LEAAVDKGTKRIPGTQWRVLVKRGDEAVELENQGVLDEVVLDDWLHLEQMNENVWWMRLGDARIVIEVAPEGTVRVDNERDNYERVSGETRGV
jgi:hypothetical protein